MYNTPEHSVGGFPQPANQLQKTNGWISVKRGDDMEHEHNRYSLILDPADQSKIGSADKKED